MPYTKARSSVAQHTTPTIAHSLLDLPSDEKAMAFVHASRRGSPYTRPEIDVDQACQLGERCELCKVVGNNRRPWSPFVCGHCFIGRSASKRRLDDACRRIMKKHIDRELALPENQPRQRNLTASNYRLLQCRILKSMCVRYTVGMTFDMCQMKEGKQRFGIT